MLTFLQKYGHLFAKIIILVLGDILSWKMEERREVAETIVGVSCVSMLKEVLRDLMGESAVIVLEHQLSKKLAAAEPFGYLLTSPRRFYEALASIIGPNAARTLLKLLFKQIASRHKLTWVRADELVEAIIASEKSAREQILKFFQEVHETGNT